MFHIEIIENMKRSENKGAIGSNFVIKSEQKMSSETKQALDFDNIKGYLWCDLMKCRCLWHILKLLLIDLLCMYIVS